MENQKSPFWWISIVAFIVVAAIGLFVTFKLANGSTIIGLVGGLTTLVAAWLAARWVLLRG